MNPVVPPGSVTFRGRIPKPGENVNTLRPLGVEREKIVSAVLYLCRAGWKIIRFPGRHVIEIRVCGLENLVIQKFRGKSVRHGLTLPFMKYAACTERRAWQFHYNPEAFPAAIPFFEECMPVWNKSGAATMSAAPDPSYSGIS